MVTQREYLDFMEDEDPSFTEPAFSQPSGGIRESFLGELTESALYGAFEGVSSTANFLSFGYIDVKNPFDDPDTWYGGLASGLSQFAVPYAGVGKVAKAASAFQAAQKGATGLSGAQKVLGAAAKPFAWLAQPEVNLAARQAAQQGKYFKFLGHTVVDASKRGAIKGAIADLVAFEGDDPNLSAILNQFEELQNPLFDVLATNEDDPEAINRLRNVAEGLLLGGVIDTILIRAKAVKNFKAAKAIGATDQEAAEITSKRMSEDIAVRESARKQELDVEYRKVKDKTFEKPLQLPKEGEVIEEAVEAPEKLSAEQLKEEFKGLMQVQQFLDNNDLTDYNSLQAFMDDAEETTKKVLGRYAKRLQEGAPDDLLRSKPKDMSIQEQMAAALDDDFANLLPYLQDSESLIVFRRALEDAAGPMFQQARLRSKSTQTLLSEALEMAGVRGVDENYLDTLTKEIAADTTNAEEAIVRLHAGSIINKRLGEHIVPMYDRMLKAGPDGLTRESLAGLGNLTKSFMQMEQEIFRSKSVLGRSLQSLGKMGIDLSSVKEDPTKAFNFVPLEEIDKAAKGMWDNQRAYKALEAASTLIRSDNMRDNAAALMEFMQLPQSKQALGLVQEYHINALLSGVSTQVVNTVSAAMMTFIRPIEQVIGAASLRIEGGLFNNPEKVAAARRIWTKELRTMNLLMSKFHDSFAAIRRSTGLDEFTKGSKIEGGRFSPLVAKASQSENASLFEPIARAITLPGNLLDKTDQFFRTWNFRAKLRGELEERFVAGGSDLLTAQWDAEGTLKAIMRSRGDTRLRLETMKSLREANVPRLNDPTADFGREASAQAQEAATGDMAKAAALEQSERAGAILRESQEFNRFRPVQDRIGEVLEGIDAAQRRGIEVTFQDPIISKDGMAPRGADIVAQKLQEMANQAPAVKFFMPFIRTPYNIARYGWDRSMGAVLGGSTEALMKLAGKGDVLEENIKSLSKFRYMLRSGDDVARAQARTNLALGVGIIGSVLQYVGQSQSISEKHELPRFTGSGPTNPDARKALEQAGWQPYSLLVGDKYISYSRLDPFATILGLSADAAEYAAEAIDNDRDSVFQAVMMGMAVSLANNLTSKTYMQGLANLTDALNDPDRNAARVFGATAGSFVPTIVAHANRVIDPEIKEIRGIVDRLRSRIPGASQGLPVRRDLLGEPMSYDAPLVQFFAPIRVTQVKDDVVRKELAQFAYGFSQPSNIRSGVDLLEDAYDAGGQKAYDRFLELSGKVRVGSMDLRQALRKEINSTGYQRLDPGLDLMGEKSPRIDRLNSIFRRYRAKAWEELQKERPQIRTDAREYKRQRARRRRGLSI